MERLEAYLHRLDEQIDEFCALAVKTADPKQQESYWLAARDLRGDARAVCDALRKLRDEKERTTT